MKNKSFKERIQFNKQFEESKRKNTNRINNEIFIKINEEYMATVEANKYVNVSELKENITDLIHFKKNFIENEKIELSKISDCFIDLVFQNQIIEENIVKAKFKLL